MATETDVLRIVREHVGRRHRISRDEMVEILAAIGEAGVPLANGYVPGTMYDTDWHEHSDHRRAARAWEQICRDSTVISVGADLRDGNVRYDQPGSMHPLQHAATTSTTRSARCGVMQIDCSSCAASRSR